MTKIFSLVVNILFAVTYSFNFICISSASDRVCDSRAALNNISEGCLSPRHCMFANPDDCNSYIQCQDDGPNAPIQHVRQCQDGHNGRLFWNDNRLTCEERSSSTCRESRCDTVVETTNGRIRGCRELVSDIHVNNVRVYSFKGIPFAEPPIGNLRFAKPLPVSNWNGVLNGEDYRNPCISQVHGDRLPGDENCLFLNVWTPSVRQFSRLPILIWFHGGGFYYGSGSTFTYSNVIINGSDNVFDGRQLAARGVVVVTVNYRLGVFGYFYANNTEAPGNMGMWDQAESIKWVRKNIFAFGGDLNAITVAGESAGSFAAAAHVYSPITRNLIRSSISESATGFQLPLIVSTAQYYAAMLSFVSNASYFTTGACSDVNTIVDCMRSKSAEELITAQIRIMNWNADISVTVQSVTFLPIYGDEFHPLNAAQMLKTGQFLHNVSLLIGHTDMDFLLFSRNYFRLLGIGSRYDPLSNTLPDLNRETYRNDIIAQLNPLPFAAKVADDYTNAFPQVLSPNDNRIRAAVIDVMSDFVTTCSTILYGSTVAASPLFTGKVYQYRFNYVSTRAVAYGSIWGGADHTEELPFVFGLPFSQSDDWNWLPKERRLSNTIMNIWAYFVKTGTVPRVNGNDWPPYTRSSNGYVSRNYLELNVGNRLGRVFYDRYRGNDGKFPPIVNNCSYWYDLLDPIFG